MKKNDWLILLSTLAYAYLFYKQTAGINFFIFSVLLTVFSFLLNTSLIRKFSWLAVAAGSVISGFAVFYLGTALTVCANIISLLLLAAYSANTGNSVFISLSNSLFSLLTSMPYIIVRAATPVYSDVGSGSSKVKKIILFIPPAIAVLVFFILYRASNPLFEKVTNQINFDFISVGWLLFALLGFILMSAFFYHQAIKYFIEADERNADALDFVSEEDHQQSWVTAIMSQPSELFTGVSLFALLNLLLLSVNGIDVYYLYIIQRLPEELTLSEYLHDGTNALIFSILLAIGIIMFYFRGRLNFISDNRLLRLLAYGWILQNIFLIGTTAKRNWFYVSNFGLTHKRIGVYVFLALCVVGLITTLIKVYKVKSGWFLFRKNTWVWYVVLVFASVINWDALIVKHNLTLARENNLPADGYYLSYLSYTSLVTLFEFYANEKELAVDSKSFTPYLVLEMKRKYEALDREVTNADWQSDCIIKRQSKNRIKSLIAKQQLSVFTSH